MWKGTGENVGRVVCSGESVSVHRAGYAVDDVGSGRCMYVTRSKQDKIT